MFYKITKGQARIMKSDYCSSFQFISIYHLEIIFFLFHFKSFQTHILDRSESKFELWRLLIFI